MANAKTIYYTIISVLSVAGAAVAKALGGWDAALQTLVLVMAVDYITGVLCALVWKKSPKSENGAFESKASLKGIFRKAGMLLVVLIAYRLDALAGTAGVVHTAVIMFFIANDGFSIVENAGIMGIKFPPAMANAFEAIKNKSDSKIE